MFCNNCSLNVSLSYLPLKNDRFDRRNPETVDNCKTSELSSDLEFTILNMFNIRCVSAVATNMLECHTKTC